MPNPYRDLANYRASLRRLFDAAQDTPAEEAADPQGYCCELAARGGDCCHSMAGTQYEPPIGDFYLDPTDGRPVPFLGVDHI